MTLPYSYPLLATVLGGLLAAGGSAGYYIGKNHSGSANPNVTAAASSPDAILTPNRTAAGEWADQARERLTADLGLSSGQNEKIRPLLDHAADEVFRERDRSLLQMHLRLLEVHDTLAKEGDLSEPQKNRLAQSRAKLKDSILSRFAAILRSDTGTLPDL